MYTVIWLIWFPLFNSISTFVGYLMPEPTWLKYSNDTIQPKAGRIIHTFPSESESNSATGVRTRFLRGCSLVH